MQTLPVTEPVAGLRSPCVEWPAVDVRKSAEAAVALPATVSLSALLEKGEEPDGTFRQLLYDMSVVAAHLESARQYLAGRLGVSSPQYNIVMVVAHSHAKSGISVGEVAMTLNVSGAFVTNEVKKLVKAQLVLKKRNPDDRRGVLLSLSPFGYEKVLALEPELLMVNDHLFAQLSRADFRHLARIVGSLIGVFGQTVAALKVMSTMADTQRLAFLPSGGRGQGRAKAGRRRTAKEPASS